MRISKLLAPLAMAMLLVALAAARADDAKSDKTTGKPIPYPLKTCIISGDTLGGDMGPPYVFVYKGQEIKFCCPGCKKDFLKDPDKYLKKIKEAAAKEAAQEKK